jgi:hypothetical protein
MSEAIIKLEEIKKDYYMGSQAITVLKGRSAFQCTRRQ